MWKTDRMMEIHLFKRHFFFLRLLLAFHLHTQSTLVKGTGYENWQTSKKYAVVMVFAKSYDLIPFNGETCIIQNLVSRLGNYFASFCFSNFKLENSLSHGNQVSFSINPRPCVVFVGCFNSFGSRLII